MVQVPYADGVVVVAPKQLIIPPEVSNTQRVHIAGEMFISGGVLFYVSGTQLRKVSAT